ncbi:hypothetical protein SYNPS1DRAFT_23869 [Syncephalis pseudoplumigaleata]|uniref:Galactosyl transferase GMA12/MNN10 family-domain-containing protein n=1 Tax=Syncephalis pseudoplumigaleata TaxID=1712513 RepID=A0A4P9YVJ6_9FUNG|nr:hypothetical protein SYNPS1DRAFT_23869 [Syncephalis pseudoplumigaleata]|eukprot:RKP24037.1 hypothetical protein SYNPS1DRAFT_23869 [Syncephalis pseudoplumigaleata]
MQSVHGLLRNRRLQFAVLAVLLLFILTLHLITREPAVLDKQASQLSQDDPSSSSSPSAHLNTQGDKPADTQNHALDNGRSDNGTGRKDDVPTTTDNSDILDPTKPRHYSMLLIIYSDYRDSDRRQLLRQHLLGLPDSIQPCMHANGDVLYKFAVRVPAQRPSEAKRLAAFRDYQSEAIEYGDVLELKTDSKWESQVELLRWVKTLKERRRLVTFDHLVYMDAYTVVRLGMYRVELASGNIAGQTLTAEQRARLYLGAEHTRAPDLAILAANTTDLMVKHALEQKGPRDDDLFAHFHDRYATTNDIHAIRDKRIYYWENSIDYLPKDAMGITGVFITDDYQLLQRRFPSQPPATCRRVASMFNVAVVTSAHIFDDNCMLDAAMASASLKRAYAIRHGYAFVARSAEYAQQNRHKHRGAGWGRLDVIQKTLPHYDWILWTDMDAVVVNATRRLVDLFSLWGREAGLDFADKHLVLTRLPGEQGVDPGVMLVRNSRWSHDFIQDVQMRREYYERDDGVQRAIGAAIKEAKWMDKMVLLNSTDHSLLTAPQDYRAGDFIVHYTGSTTCPAAQVLKATKQLESGQVAGTFTP